MTNNRYFDNIEPSGFHKGHYVGYAHGAWKIRPFNSMWLATKQDDASKRLYAHTLREMSHLLDIEAKKS